MTEHGRSHPGPMRVATCKCGAVGEYDERCDLYRCPTSHVPLEGKCGDLECEFCTLREDDSDGNS